MFYSAVLAYLLFGVSHLRKYESSGWWRKCNQFYKNGNFIEKTTYFFSIASISVLKTSNFSIQQEIVAMTAGQLCVTNLCHFSWSVNRFVGWYKLESQKINRILTISESFSIFFRKPSRKCFQKSYWDKSINSSEILLYQMCNRCCPLSSFHGLQLKKNLANFLTKQRKYHKYNEKIVCIFWKICWQKTF